MSLHGCPGDDYLEDLTTLPREAKSHTNSHETTDSTFRLLYDQYLSRLLAESEREESRWNRNILYSRRNIPPYDNLPLTCGEIDDSSFVISDVLVNKGGALVVGNTYSLLVDLVHAKNRSQATACTEATFKARLFGDSIVPVSSIQHIGNGTYQVDYIVHEPGYYILEIVAVTIEGQTRTPTLHVWKTPFLMNRLIYRSPHLLQFQNARGPRKFPGPKHACTGKDDIADGRWRHVTDGICENDAGVCSGSNLDVSHINDRCGLNFNYAWSPYECYLHIYSADEFHQCCQDCGYQKWTVFGDSLPREMFQNLVMIAVGFRGRELTKGYQPVQHVVNGITFYYSGPMNWANIFPKDESNVLLGNFDSVHQLGNLDAMQTVISRTRIWLQDLVSYCSESKNKECLYYVNPSIQQEAVWSDVRLNETFFPFSLVTIERMASLNAAMRQQAKAWNIATLDGESMTKAHWSSSWDGMHYSEADNHFDPDHDQEANKGWSGGVSIMITQALINLLCNKPCNRRSDRE